MTQKYAPSTLRTESAQRDLFHNEKSTRKAPVSRPGAFLRLLFVHSNIQFYGMSRQIHLNCQILGITYLYLELLANG